MFFQEGIGRLNVGYAAIHSKYARLSEAVVHRYRFRTEVGREFAAHALGDRLRNPVRSIENVLRLLPPETACEMPLSFVRPRDGIDV